MFCVVAIIPRCCPQHRTFFRFVAHNAELLLCSTLLPTTLIIFSALQATTRKSTLIFSLCVFFSVVVVPRCGPQCRKMSVLFSTLWKNGRRCWQQRGKIFKLEYLHKLNHMQTNTRVSIRGLGWCVSWRKVEAKNLVGLFLRSSWVNTAKKFYQNILCTYSSMASIH